MKTTNEGFKKIQDERQNGYWVSWNDFLGIDLFEDPKGYLHNMLEELENSDTENTPKFLLECNEDYAMISCRIEVPRSDVERYKKYFYEAVKHQK